MCANLAKLFDFHGLGEIGAQPRDGFRHAVHAGFRPADLGHPDPDGTAEQPDQDLLDDEGGEQLRLPGLRHQFEQPCRGVDDPQVDRADVDATVLWHARQAVRIHLQDQLGNLVRVEIQPEREVRLGGAGFRDLASHWQIHGEHQHPGRVVLIDLLPQQHAFRALRDDAQGGSRHGMHQLRVRFSSAPGWCRPADRQARNTPCLDPGKWSSLDPPAKTRFCSGCSKRYQPSRRIAMRDARRT